MLYKAIKIYFELDENLYEFNDLLPDVSRGFEMFYIDFKRIGKECH